MILSGFLAIFVASQQPAEAGRPRVIDVRSDKQLVCGELEPTAIGTHVRRCEWKTIGR